MDAFSVDSTSISFTKCEGVDETNEHIRKIIATLVGAMVQWLVFPTQGGTDPPGAIVLMSPNDEHQTNVATYPNEGTHHNHLTGLESRYKNIEEVYLLWVIYQLVLLWKSEIEWTAQQTCSSTVSILCSSDWICQSISMQLEGEQRPSKL